MQFGALGRLLDLGRAYWDSQVLLASVHLGVFETIAKPAKADDVARALRLDGRGTAMLLDALAALRFAVKKGDTYRIAGDYAPFLLKDSPASVTAILNHYHHMWDDWGGLQKAVKTGKPVVKRNMAKRSKDVTDQFITGMDNLTKFTTERIVVNIDLTGVKKILDVGSGPATYLREMLKKDKKLQGSILDYPDAAGVARRFLKNDGLLSRVKFIEGDLETAAYGKGYDVILISQVLHSLNPSAKAKAVRKAYEALNAGGRLYLHEFLMNETRTAPKDSVVFCLNMLIHAPGGDNLTAGEIKTLLTSNGFKLGKVIKFHRPYTVLAEGVKGRE